LRKSEGKVGKQKGNTLRMTEAPD